MTKIESIKNLIEFLPELFPSDLAAITIADCEKFISIWVREGNYLGEAIKKSVYPGKPLTRRVISNKVVEEKRKFSKYFSKQESVADMPYLSVGVPIFEENGEISGAICIIKEESLFEAQNRCRSLLQINDILTTKTNQIVKKLDYFLKSYKDTRAVHEYMQEVSQKASLLEINILLESALVSSEREMQEKYTRLSQEIKEMAEETKKSAMQIIQVLNNFDLNAADFFSSINYIETIVKGMNNSINSISEFLSQQSNILLINESEDTEHLRE